MIELRSMYGTLNLPREDCVYCIYTNRFMSCTSCQFKTEWMDSASEWIKKNVEPEEEGEE